MIVQFLTVLVVVLAHWYTIARMRQIERRLRHEKYATPLNPVEQIPKTHFIPHRDDPFLSLHEAGRLIGRTHTTIGRWIDDGLIEAVKDGRGCRRIRTSELIRFSGVVQESQLHPDYLPQADYDIVKSKI